MAQNRLIDANDFLKALENADADVCEEYPDCDCDWGFSRKAIEELVQNIPTVDAVEVVRCKDCRYFEIDHDDFLGLCKCGNIATSYAGEIYPEREHFCSYGERKDNERKAD